MLLGLGVAIIFAAIFKKKSMDEPSTEVEQLLHQFMEEMETENERLMSKITEQTDRVNKELLLRDKKIEQLMADFMNLRQQHDQLKKELSNTSSSSPIANRYKEVFHLFEQGLTIDEVAKKTGMGKGELLLITQLAKEESVK